MTRLRHVWLALLMLPGLALHAGRRSLLREMLAFSRRLPKVLRAPLPHALQQLTPAVDARQGGRPAGEADTVRALADVAALLDRGSPLGLCLRRSLTRYYFLRRVGLPVVLQFGAKFVEGRPDREVAGHAWLALAGRPYFEADENWRGFVAMITFPEETT